MLYSTKELKRIVAAHPQLNGLRARSIHCLRNYYNEHKAAWDRAADIEEITKQKVATLTIVDLMRIPNCGRTTILDIRLWLQKDGLDIRPISESDLNQCGLPVIPRCPHCGQVF